MCPQFRAKGGQGGGQDAEARLEEGKGLALAIGIVVADAFIVPIREARAATLFGEGQVRNIEIACEQSEAELVIDPRPTPRGSPAHAVRGPDCPGV